jgi:hypothetical protein
MTVQERQPAHPGHHRAAGAHSVAIDLLGPRIIGAQAKDVVESGYSAPGTRA